MIELNKLYNCDCMELMAQIPDKYFELAIVDPPYGGVTKGGYMQNAPTTSGVAKHRNYHLALWNQNKPPAQYFDELKRVSKNQIIWGGELLYHFDWQRFSMLGCVGQAKRSNKICRL